MSLGSRIARSGLLVVIAALAVMALSVGAALPAEGQGQTAKEHGQNHGKTIDLGLSLVSPSADPAIATGYTSNFDLVLHNYSAKSGEKYTVSVVLADFGDEGSTFDLNPALCALSSRQVGSEANEYLCSGSIAAGESITLVEAGTNNVDMVLLFGAASIAAEQHPDPVASNDEVTYQLPLSG
jgi:hypothetical protein